jgi:tripartite-type tricarboxylate transporter receptor subunit TctC
MADKLSQVLKQRFYVDNRAGGGGLIGANIVAHAEPDGYTFVTSSLAYHVIEPAASANPGFDPMRDATHVAYIGGPPNVFIVSPALGVHSVGELIARGRDKTLDFVSPGNGTVGHLLVEAFAREAGMKVQHIPHKGSAQAMLDLLAGNVLFGSMTYSSALGQIRAGKVIPVAVSSKGRVAEYPDVPTLAESGYPDLVANTWYALSGPAGLPDEIVQKLNRAVAEVLELPDVKKRLDDDAIEREPMTPEQVTKLFAAEIARWGPIAKRFVKHGG